MGTGKGGPHGRHGGGEPRFVEADAIEIAFHHDQVSPGSGFLARPVQAVEQRAFLKRDGFGGVGVFGDLIAKGASRHSHQVPEAVPDGKNKPAAETVIGALLSLDLDAGLDKIPRGKFGTEHPPERVEPLRRPTQFPQFPQTAVQFSPRQIVRAGVGFVLKAFSVVARHGRENVLEGHLADFARPGRFPDKRNSVFAREKFKSLAEGEILHQHIELENIAAPAAAEAVEQSQVVVEGERGCFFLVAGKGAEGGVPGARGFDGGIRRHRLQHGGRVADAVHRRAVRSHWPTRTATHLERERDSPLPSRSKASGCHPLPIWKPSRLVPRQGRGTSRLFLFIAYSCFPAFPPSHLPAFEEAAPPLPSRSRHRDPTLTPRRRLPALALMIFPGRRLPSEERKGGGNIILSTPRWWPRRVHPDGSPSPGRGS